MKAYYEEALKIVDGEKDRVIVEAIKMEIEKENEKEKMQKNYEEDYGDYF